MEEKLFNLLCREAIHQLGGGFLTREEADTLTEEQALHLLLLKAKITITFGVGKSTILEEYFRPFVIKYRQLFEEGYYRE